MRILPCGMMAVLLLSASCALAKGQPSRELTAISEAYQATVDNLVSGSGTGTYEIYTARAGKGSKLELKIKAKTKVFFDRSKFHIRLDYERDDLHHLDTRIIIFDGTAILVNRMSKNIFPSHSEGDIYEAEPALPIMRQTCFDYNPCRLAAEILPVDLLPKEVSALSITPGPGMDYSGTFNLSPNVHRSFVASSKTDYHITACRDYSANANHFQYLNVQATWDRKNHIWYVKSIDTQWFKLDGSSERIIFQYNTFDPNADVSSSLFKFDALSLSSNARFIDRRPNAEEPVLRQSRSSLSEAAKLDTLADTVSALAPKSTPPQPPSLGKYYLLISGALLCILGLLLLWRKRRRRGDITTGS